MTAKITVTLGGGTAATDLEFTDSVPFFTPGEGGVGHWSFETTFANGDDGLGEFLVDNDDGAIPKTDGTRNLAAKNPVTLTEDASGTEYTLVYGRIVEKEVTRNEDYPIADASQYRVTVQAPGDLALMKLTENWVRDAESDYDRLVALQAYILNGGSSTVDRPWNTVDITVDSDHLAPNTNTVVMPAHTYQAGTSIDDIIIDCATTAGKVWGVVPHHVDGVGSHRCLQYIVETDNDTNASTVSISDVPADIDPVADPPVIAPQWGTPRHEAGQEQITTLVVRYGTGDNFVVVESPHIDDDVDSYDQAIDVFYDDESETEAQAQARGLAMLDYRRFEHVTHTVILKVRADQVHLISAGMSIDITSAAAMSGSYLHTVQTRRIASVQYEPLAPEVGEVEGFYQLTIELDRRLRRMPPSKGTKPGPTGPSGSCTDVTSTLAPHFIDGTTTDWGVGGSVRSGSAGQGHGSGAYFGTSSGLDINCFVEYHDTGTFIGGRTYTLRYWYRSNFTNDMPYAFGVGAATGVAGSPGTPTDGVTGTISLIGDSEWRFHQIEWTPSANRTGVTLRWGAPSGDTGQFDVSDGSLEECSDAEAPPAADDTTGDPGTGDSCFSPCDHKHPVQTAAVTPFTPDGSIAATNVQDAIVEVRDESASLSDDTPLVESGTGSAGTATDASRSDHVHPADGGGGGGGITHAYVGYNTIGATWVAMTHHRVLMKKVTLAADGMLQNVAAYIRAHDNASTTSQINSIQAAVFDDSAGDPKHIIGYYSANKRGDLFPSHTTGAGDGRWLHMPMPIWLPAGSYWIAVQFMDNGSVNFDIAKDGSGADRYFVTNGDWFTDAGFTTVTTTTDAYSIRASVLS